ncbi:MAG: hypothetical protein HDR03_07525 [Lachnospiraceae bacterium]|nr:hypothetical protein [Lachnospiraceae bacterium]
MRYGNEGMDLKKLCILLLQKFWIVVLAAVIGAGLGAGIYLIHNVALSSNREYQAQSKVYLDFAPDETGEVYQHYNGYTWNDLMSTNLIIDTTMSYLPEDYTTEEVSGATLAEILSDVRLLTITITTSDAERTAKILDATDRALVEMGQREQEFIGIEIIKETEPKLLVADSRLVQAVLVGLVIGLVFMFIAMALGYVLDDRIYVPGDLKCVTELPFVGFSFMQTVYNGVHSDNIGDSDNQKEADNWKETDNRIDSDRKRKLIQKLQADLEKNNVYLTNKFGELAAIEISTKNDITEQEFTNARNANGVLLVIPYGKLDRSSLAYRIEQFSLQECKLAGIIIKDADMRFMKWYYNHL